MKSIRILSLTFILLCLAIGCAERKDTVTGAGGNALVLVSQKAVQGAAKDVAVVNGLAYVADEPFGVSVYDVSNPDQPQFVETIALQGTSTRARLVAVDPTGRVLCVESDNLQFFDLLNGHYLGIRGSGGHVEVELFFDGNSLEVYRCDQDESDGFNYENFSNVGTEDSLSFNFPVPDYFSRYWGNFALYGFTLGGDDIAYTTRNTTGFAAIDYSVGQVALVVAETNTIGKARDAALSGDILYLAAGYEGLLTYDVSEPSAPQFLASLLFQYATDIEWIEIAGNIAFLLDDNDGLFAADISDPNNPIQIGELETSDPNNFTVSGDHVYIADEDMGLVIGQILD